MADLARLSVSEEEMEQAREELGSILGFVDRLKEVDTKDVEPMSMPARTEWREDSALPCDEVARELILSNFPERNGDLLRTPGVFEKPKGKK